MKKMLAMLIFASALICVAGCGRRAVKEEPAVKASVIEAPVAVTTPPAAAPAAVKAPADPKVLAAEQKYSDGLKQFNKNDYQGALKTWQDCLKLDPKNQDCQAGARAAKDTIDNLSAASK